jgi:septal ring factor EnvC (AmiA/AmiB activator)
LKSAKASFEQFKSNRENIKAEVQNIESQLLETEFELKEVEISKQVRAEDARLNEILDELKKRCRGYLG